MYGPRDQHGASDLKLETDLFVLIACGRMLFFEHEVWNNANILV